MFGPRLACLCTPDTLLPQQESVWFLPAAAYPVARQMALESKPLFHPEVIRHRGLPPNLVPRRPGLSPPPPLELPSKRWRDLILRVWHVDPLRCPVCQSPMRVIALIDDARVAEKILRHLGAWHDPPARLPPADAPGPYTYEACDDADPMPDYENVLTD